MNSLSVALLNTNKDWGGGENQVLSTLRNMPPDACGCVLLACPAGQLYRRAMAESIDTIAIAKNPSLPFFRELAASRGIQLIHAQDSASLKLGIAMKKALKIPLLYTRRVASPLRRNPFSKRKYSIANIDMVAAISRTVAAVFADSGYPRSRIRVIPSGLDLAQLAAAPPLARLRERFGDAPLLGGLGSLTPKKNWSFLIETAAVLRKHLPLARWLIFGEGEERRELEEMIRAKGLRDVVCLMGFEEDGIGVLKALDVLFFPSVMEGAGVTVREAMAVGTPVVAVDAPGTVESLADCGWLVSDGSAEEAVESIVEVLQNKSTRNQRVAAAVEFAQMNYDIRSTSRGYAQLYRDMVLEKDGTHA